MFQFLKMTHFQTHRGLKIEFDKAITTIIGATDTGKSSIMRAIRWNCLNQPSGDAFITNGEKGCVVTLCVDNRIVGRKRARSGENAYRLDDQEYKAFGINTVPQPIAEFLAISDINFSGQFDGPFWFSLTGLEVSQRLNQIVDLEIIDTSMQRIGTRVRQAQATVRVTKERLDKAEIDRASLEWVVAANSDLIAVEGIEKELTKTKEQSTALRALVFIIELTNMQIVQSAIIQKQLNAVIDAGSNLIAVSERQSALHDLIASVQQNKIKITEFKSMREQLAEVGKLGQELIDISERATSLRNLLEVSASLRKSLNQPIPDISELELLVNDIRELQFKRQRLSELLLLIGASEMDRDKASAKFEAAEKELKDVKECPTCGRELL